MKWVVFLVVFVCPLPAYAMNKYLSPSGDLMITDKALSAQEMQSGGWVLEDSLGAAPPVATARDPINQTGNPDVDFWANATNKFKGVSDQSRDLSDWDIERAIKDIDTHIELLKTDNAISMSYKMKVMDFLKWLRVTLVNVLARRAGAKTIEDAGRPR